MHTTMTFGVMPTEEQFDQACQMVDDEGRSVAEHGFGFGNDPRVGTDRLTQGELWKECQRAFEEYSQGSDPAGDWLSSVLGCLGFEWV